MKLIIDIPEDSYEATCNGCMLPPMELKQKNTPISTCGSLRDVRKARNK